MFLKILLFLLSLAYTSCSSQLVVLRPNCSELNWFERGRQDGMQGQPSNNWFMKARECENMSEAEIQNYMDGWNHGLSMFCTEEHGFSTARSGAAYRKICPEKYEESFLKGYREGFAVYMIEKETASLITQVEDLEKEMQDQKSTDEDKAKLRKDIDELNQKKSANLRTLEKYNSVFNR